MGGGVGLGNSSAASHGHTAESRQANFSLVKMVMPIAGNDGPMGPGPLAHGPWPIGPMGPGPLGPGPLGPPGDQKYRFFKKSGNGFPWCGNVGVPRGSVFNLSRASQLPYSDKSIFFVNKSTHRLFPYFCISSYCLIGLSRLCGTIWAWAASQAHDCWVDTSPKTTPLNK